MSACKGSGVDNSLFLRRLRKGGIHVLSEQTNLKSFRHLPCLLQDAFVHQYHRVRSDKSQELSPTCHGGSAGWYVLVDGLTTVQLSEGFCLRFSWGAGHVVKIAVLLAGTGQNFLFLLHTPPAMLSKLLTPGLCAPRSDILLVT